MQNCRAKRGWDIRQTTPSSAVPSMPDTWKDGFLAIPPVTTVIVGAKTSTCTFTVTLFSIHAYNYLRLVCPKGMWYTTIAFCRKTGNRSIREGTAKDDVIWRRPARDSLGHTSRLDRTRTGAAFSFLAEGWELMN